MTAIEQCVLVIHRRQQRQWIWKCVSVGLLWASLAGCLFAILRWWSGSGVSWPTIAAVLLAGPTVGALFALLRGPSLRSAAIAIDRVCGLKDRTQTALGFLQNHDEAPLKKLQIEDAEQHLSALDPTQVAPIRNPPSFPWAVALAIVAIAIVIVTTPRREAVAAVMPSKAVATSATRAEEAFQELKQFQQEQPDPELEKLLTELATQIEQLKQPGVAPKEALAELSEMEAALVEMQQKLTDPGLEAQLQQVGDALALSEAMAAAGQAMAKGEMEKASEELEKMEMPKLDRKTEKAITEELDKLKQNDGDGGANRKKLSSALGQISSGLSKGDRSKFKDGMEGLAGQCKSQGRRKKLSDLLRKQCRSLSECKSDCEGECKSSAESNKKGGSKAGTARSGNDPGDKTPSLKTNPQMNITGQDSGQGDIDVETTTGPQQQQEAVRQYRAKAGEYEAMSESVLSSESIPLGHRQTIRRYFESIRPQGSETDQVIEQSGGDLD